MQRRLRDFIKQLQKKVNEDTCICIWSLTPEIGIEARIMKLSFNEDLRYQLYKNFEVQLLTEKARENYMTKQKKLVNKVLLNRTI